MKNKILSLLLLSTIMVGCSKGTITDTTPQPIDEQTNSSSGLSFDKVEYVDKGKQSDAEEPKTQEKVEEQNTNIRTPKVERVEDKLETNDNRDNEEFTEGYESESEEQEETKVEKQTPEDNDKEETEVTKSVSEASSQSPIDKVEEVTKKIKVNYNSELFKEFDKNEGSYIFSPYSIMDCLTLCYDGLSDNAKKALEDKGVSEDTVKSFINFDKTADNDYLSVANKVYLNKYLEGSFNLDLIRKDDYELCSMDNVAAIEMNQWVENKTHDKIHNLIPEDAVTPDLTMVLLNAVYMNKKWQNKDFHEYDLDWVTGTKYKGFCGDLDISNVRDIGERLVVRIPYEENENHKIAMYCIMNNPDINTIVPIEPLDLSTITMFTKFDHLDDQSNYSSAIIYAPNFEISYKGKILDKLVNIGLTDVLKESAYEKIGHMYVDDVFHGAYIKTDKDGTEAAAATAMMMKDNALAVVEDPSKIRHIYLNQPFYFIIKDDLSDTVLFEGKVTEDSLTEADSENKEVIEGLDSDVSGVQYIEAGEYPDAPEPQVINNKTFAKVRLTRTNGAIDFKVTGVDYQGDNCTINILKTSEGIGTDDISYLDIIVPLKYEVSDVKLNIEG